MENVTLDEMERIAFWLWVIRYPVAAAPAHLRSILHHLESEYDYAQRVAARVIQGYAPVGMCDNAAQIRAIAWQSLRPSLD
jgi:hypothetical protein